MRPHTLIVLCLFIPSLAANAVELEPGNYYQGPQLLETKSLGLSFVLPEGFEGLIQQGAEYFIAESADSMLMVYADIASEAEVRALMQSTIPLDSFLFLNPVSAISKHRGWLSAEYDVIGRDDYRATIRAAANAANIGLMFIALGPDMSRLRNLVTLLEKTAMLNRPAPRTTASWSAELGNQVIKRYFRNTDYYEEFSLTLCADGRFYRTITNGGFDTGASIGEAEGRWTASGHTHTEGKLVLEHGDGSEYVGSSSGSEWIQADPGGEVRLLQLEYIDDDLYLDGTHWYRAEAARC